MADVSVAPPWRISQWFNARQPLDLDALRGQVVVLHAFQILCPGCVSHGVPQAERIHRLFDGDGVVVVGLHTVFEHHAAMTPVSLAAFLHEYRVTHPVGVDLHEGDDPIPVTMRSYGLEGTPSLVLIDREGRLRLRHFGRLDDLTVGREVMRLASEEVRGASLCTEASCRLDD